MDEVLRIEPLADRRFAISGLSLEPCPPAERISLRAVKEAFPAIRKALGFSLPAKPKKSASAKGVTALWLGPDEWLLIGPPNGNLVGKLGNVDAPLSAVDVSHRNTALTIEGPKAETALASGCPQDLSQKTFPVGACSRTILGKSEIVLLRESETRFRVECWRSFSDYVRKYLVDAAKSA